MKAIFRKFKDDNQVIAFLPEVEARHGYMVNYMHVGQHGEADYKALVKTTILAKPEEYAALLNELEGIYKEPIQVAKRA